MVPFLVVGMPRTGSTLMSTGLAQHPQIKCYGELFHPVLAQRQMVHAIRDEGEVTYFDPTTDDAIAFLKSHVYGEKNADFKAVGFKLFGDYAAGKGSDGLFRRLKAEIPGLAIFHIRRANYLDALVSREIAKLTKQWVVFKGEEAYPTKVETVSLDRAMVARFFEGMLRMDEFYRMYFGGGAYLRLDYEELDDRYAQAMSRAYEFLGVSPFQATPMIQKQRTRTARQTVANYGELAATFKEGPFAAFFNAEPTPRTAVPPPFKPAAACVPMTLSGTASDVELGIILGGDLRGIIDAAARRAATETDLSIVLEGIPLDLFALMQIASDRLPEALRNCIPPLPSTAEQVSWTGDNGLALMLRSSDYMKLITNRYLRLRGKPLSQVNFLDYGCGWGRVARFAAALIPNRQIYGLDPIQTSLDICARDGVPGTYIKCDAHPEASLDLGCKFDIINSFSVFSHLSEPSHRAVLRAIRGLIADDGLAFISIRTDAFWTSAKGMFAPGLAEAKRKEHAVHGFAFVPGRNGPNLNQEFGDSSISLDYVREKWTDWSLEAVEFSHYQPNQLFLCLAPQ